MTLDVGEFPWKNTSAHPLDDEDPTRLPRLTAHAVARFADRIAPLRKFSRHMEGTERKAGLASDLLAALMALYRRNPEAMQVMARTVASDVKVRQAARKNATSPSTPNGNGEPTYATR